MLARAVLGAVAAAALVVAPAVGAASPKVDRLTGSEVPPISSTRGTFVGVARGQLLAAWRAQIVHEPLSRGSTVAVTGGSFTLVTGAGRVLGGRVTDGSVAVVSRGEGCTNQTYRVTLAFASGSFAGSLTHHRRSVFGRCLVLAATIAGRGVFAG